MPGGIGFRRRRPHPPVLFFSSRNGEYRALSNFFPSKLFSSTGGVVALCPLLRDSSFPDVEHFYQAAKMTNSLDKEKVQRAATPKLAKDIAYRLPWRKDWEDIKFDVMLWGLRYKFAQNPDLRKTLLETDDAEIHEDSPFDFIWGWGKGSGKDLLGKALMQVRSEFREPNCVTLREIVIQEVPEVSRRIHRCHDSSTTEWGLPKGVLLMVATDSGLKIGKTQGRHTSYDEDILTVNSEGKIESQLIEYSCLSEFDQNKFNEVLGEHVEQAHLHQKMVSAFLELKSEK